MKKKKNLPKKTIFPSKKRASTYDAKLAINGTFEDVIAVLVKDKPKVAPRPKK